MQYYVERFGPLIFAFATAGIIYYFRIELAVLSQENYIDIKSIYSSIFGWSSIQTGFIFAIFGYIGGKSDGFLGEVKHTPAMRLFMGYMRTAILLGFILTFTSIPLMVVQFGIGDGNGWRAPLFAGWSALSVWAFFAFLRVAYIFGLLLRPGEKT